MKKLFVIFAAIIILTACEDNTYDLEIEKPPTQHQTSSEPELDAASEQSLSIESIPDEQETIEYYSFVAPEVEHIYKDEMVRQLDEFSVEVIFPEFQNVEHLDYYSRNVSTNIYRLAYDRNEDLALQGRGISRDDLKIIEEMVIANFPEDQRHPPHRTVRRDDMTMIGREYFGEQFEFPASLIAPEIMPLDKDSKYYIFSSGRAEGLPEINYILLDVTEEDDTIFATFIPFIISVTPPDNMIYGIKFFGFINSSRDDYLADLEEPIEFQPDVEPSFYLSYVLQLPVPQDELGTITVTFSREDNGNLIATSCKYNRK